MRPRCLLFFAVCFGVGRASPSTPPTQVGEWTSFPNSLPNPRLPHTPLLGNGALGVSVDARNDTNSGVGGGGVNAIDLYLSSTSFWSCGECASLALGCCRLVALGGVSISLARAFPSMTLYFSATQTFATGAVAAKLATANGGELVVSLAIHPVERVLAANVSWAPASGDPATLNVDVSVWVPPPGAPPGEPKPFPKPPVFPAPASTGCLPAGAPAGAQPQPCASAAQAETTTIVASRHASTPNATVGGVVTNPIWAALAVGAHGSASAPTFSDTSADGTMQSTMHLNVAAAAPLNVIVAEVEAQTNTTDPSATAAALVELALAGDDTASIVQAAITFWDDFWAVSSVALPSMPAVEDLWVGAQAALGSTASVDATVPAPALFGVWVTTDEVGWNGDFTLDYNAESTFYGAYSSGHANQTISYFPVMLDFVVPARAIATKVSSTLNISCPGATLFACHLAPHGYQSWDQTIYMQWNGDFAALAFINRVEYLQDADFARDVAFPFLDGLNAWWACALNKTATGPGPDDYVYHDTRGDEEHEKGVSVDPQIGVAFAHRSLSAQLDMAAALNLSAPALYADILAHLVPPNTSPGCIPDSHVPPRWPCGGFNYSAPDGEKFSNLTVWTAYGGAPVHNSDCFSLYPLWPSEYTASLGVPMDAATAAIAQASARAYAQLVGGRPVDTFASAVFAGQGYFFNSSMRAGGSVVRSAGARAAPEYAFAPLEVLRGLLGQMDSPCPGCCPCGPGGKLFGPNLQLFTFGGGVENIGVSRAVNEMLVSSIGGAHGVIQLFPFWPASEPAAFNGLLVKGGFRVSAAYDNVTASITALTLTAAFTWNGAPNATARLMDPWGQGDGTVKVTCNGADTPVVWSDRELSFVLPSGVECDVASA